MARVVVAIIALCLVAIPTPATPFSEADARNTAHKYLVEIVGVSESEATSFVHGAAIGAITHTATNGYQTTLRDDQFAIDVSLTRNEVFAFEVERERQTLLKCDGVNQRVTINDQGPLVAAEAIGRQYFPQAPIDQMELVSARRRCGSDARTVAEFVFREGQDERGVVITYDSLSVELNPDSLHLVRARYLHSRYTGPVNVSAAQSTKLVESAFGGHPGFRVTRLALTEYLREDKPPLPLWVVSFNIRRSGLFGGSASSQRTCFVHAITGQIAQSLDEYD